MLAVSRYQKLWRITLSPSDSGFSWHEDAEAQFHLENPK